jgi:hypothetical protein
MEKNLPLDLPEEGNITEGNETSFDSGTADTEDIFENISLSREDEVFGEAKTNSRRSLYVKYGSFLHDFEVRAVYSIVNFADKKIQSIHYGDIFEGGYVFVGATEVYEKTFLHFLSLNDAKDIISIMLEKYIDEKEILNRTELQLSTHGLDMKPELLSFSIDAIKKEFVSLCNECRPSSPR